MSSLSAAPGLAVLVVAPPTLQRQGLIATLREARPNLALTITSDVGSLAERICRDAPALVILDASLPNVPFDEVIEQVRAVCPKQRILILGGKRIPFHLSRLIVEMGGGMLLARRATPQDLLAAVAQLIGDAPASNFLAHDPTATYSRRLLVSSSAAALTSREKEILHLVAADHSNAEIATRLSISIRTVEAHRRLLLEKAGTRSMIGLMLHAVRSGWLTVA